MPAPAGEATVPAGAGNRLATNITAGIVCGFLSIVLSIGNGSLVFAAHETAYLPIAIGLALFSTAVMALVVSLSSSIKASVAVVQEVPCVALGVVVGAAAQQLSASVAPNQRLVTIMVTVGLGTLVTGIAVALLGAFRFGGIVRFMPYSVIGGFLAGTGWLVFLGGLGIVLGVPATLEAFHAVDDPGALPRLALAVLFVLVLVLARWRVPGPFVLPVVIFAALLLFNLVAALSGAGTDALRSGGWLVELPRTGQMWPAIDFGGIAKVDWRAVAVAMLHLPILIVITAISLLLNATGIEMELRDDVRLDRELRSVGAANVLSGVGGGLPGFQSLSLTLIGLRLGADSRWVGIVVAAISAVALVFGTDILDVVPTLVLGGMLIWMGSSLMVEWAIRVYRRIDPWDYAIVLLIFVVVVVVGFAAGIATGMVAAILLFVFQYSRIDIVRHELTGRDYQSRADGSALRQARLRRHGDAILIVRLQGFIFFGTADSLRRRLQDRIRETGRGAGYLVIDFRRVTGLDSSATAAFARLRQVAAQEGFTVVLTGLSDKTRQKLLRGDLLSRNGPAIRIEPDLERGLRWCEDALLAETSGERGESRPLTAVLAELVEGADAAEVIARYGERIAAGAGTTLIEQGTPSDDIFVVESGHASVVVADDGAMPLQLATVGPGAIVGEVAFYTRAPRSASVVAEEEMIVWRFSREAFERMQAEAADAALGFHRGMAAMLSKRLLGTNRQLSFLAD